MCSNPYIDEILVRQHIAEARADAAQRHLLQSAKPRRAPGIWARARDLLHTAVPPLLRSALPGLRRWASIPKRKHQGARSSGISASRS
jgi:hypothetical protein